MLLPSAFQDKDIPCTLGKKVERQEPAKADPLREFERHNHDIPCVAKLPDEYVKEAAKEMKRQWEENLHAKRNETLAERANKRIDELDRLNRQALARSIEKMKEQSVFLGGRKAAIAVPAHGEYRNGMVWDSWAGWIPLAQWNAKEPSIQATCLEELKAMVSESKAEICAMPLVPFNPMKFPKIDASAVPVGQPLYMWGESSVEGSWPVLGAEGK
jgi:hypothetical protein